LEQPQFIQLHLGLLALEFMEMDAVQGDVTDVTLLVEYVLVLVVDYAVHQPDAMDAVDQLVEEESELLEELETDVVESAILDVLDADVAQLDAAHLLMALDAVDQNLLIFDSKSKNAILS
jgi:Tfp pilus assembly protein PilO